MCRILPGVRNQSVAGFFIECIIVFWKFIFIVSKFLVQYTHSYGMIGPIFILHTVTSINANTSRDACVSRHFAMPLCKCVVYSADFDRSIAPQALMPEHPQKAWSPAWRVQSHEATGGALDNVQHHVPADHDANVPRVNTG